MSICCGTLVVRPPLDDRRHGLNQAVAGTRSSESWKEEAEIVVVEVELGTAFGVRGIDPLAAAEEPVAGIAAMIEPSNHQQRDAGAKRNYASSLFSLTWRPVVF